MLALAVGAPSLRLPCCSRMAVGNWCKSQKLATFWLFVALRVVSEDERG